MKRKEGPCPASMLILWALTVSASFGLTQYIVRTWIVSTLTPAPWALQLASSSHSDIVLKEPWIEPFKRIQVSYDEDYLPDDEPPADEAAPPRSEARLEALRLLLHQTDMIQPFAPTADITPPASAEHIPEENIMKVSASDANDMQQAVR